MKRKGFDVAVIGGGPAGMVAAYHAARAGCRVILLDRNRRPGEKILLSGGGRCNILPRETVDPSSYTTDSSPHTMRKILSSWPLPEVRSFLEGPVGLRLIEQRRTGKVYPLFGGGEEVRDRLLAAVRRSTVVVRTGKRVIEISPSERRRVVLEEGEAIVADRVVLSTGGVSYPRTGSDGAGHEIARALGHHLVEPYPALVALRGGNAAHHDLAGLSIYARLTAGSGKTRVQAQGDFLFTHRGYSGPVVLNIAHVAARAALADEHVPITVAWGRMNEQDWEEALVPSGKTVRGTLKEVLPDRLIDLLLAELNLSTAKLATLRRDDRKRLLSALLSYPLPWRRSGGWNEAEVTGGGVSLGDIDPRSLESRVVPGLYLCGEILDAFGPIGGTNFLWAFVTGKLAGEGAAQQ
ncbi:aminoacetone oxidase family FAD-binding enzyme [Candidatus Bipolaricaulota bacterium]|nr:aminoacetone oxidase family FAD-binding enzyme [Candidatus Bipolaricaulota bacterium]